VPEDAKRDTDPETPERAATEERPAEGGAAATEPDAGVSEPGTGAPLAEGKPAPEPQADAAERFEKLPTIEVEGELIEEGAGSEPAARDEGRDVQAELAAAQVEAERHLDDLRRLKADFENYRKRMLREQTAMVTTASQALVTKLLPVLDHFELALGSAEQSKDFDKMLKGVEMVFSELREVMRGQGLEPIEAEGKPFDPQRHEAVASVSDAEAEPGTVVGVVRTGYELQGRVIRPAMVKVAQ